jgi:3-oxoacyl-[acyl-carrier protein] reductase
MDLGLQDKVALVTGSSRGLGLASAKALAAEGARVMLTARGAEQLARAAEEVVALSSTDAVQTTVADLATAAGVEHAVAATVAAFGRLDVLVNNWAWAVGGTARHQRRDWARHSIRPCIRRSARAGSLSRTCGKRAEASSSSSPRSGDASQAAA